MQALFSPSPCNPVYFLYLDTSHTWNHPLCGLLCLACCGLLPPFGFVTSAAAVHKCAQVFMHTFISLRLLFSRSVVSNPLRPHGLQHAGLPCPSSSPGASSNLYPLSQWRHPTISSSVDPFSSCRQCFPASGSFPMSQLLVLSPCSPRDSQESSPAPQFESVSPLALSLLYDPTLTSIHDFWKKHSFD